MMEQDIHRKLADLSAGNAKQMRSPLGDIRDDDGDAWKRLEQEE